MSISIIQTMVLTQITQIRSFLNLVWKPSRTTLMHHNPRPSIHVHVSKPVTVVSTNARSPSVIQNEGKENHGHVQNREITGLLKFNDSNMIFASNENHFHSLRLFSHFFA